MQDSDILLKVGGAVLKRFQAETLTETSAFSNKKLRTPPNFFIMNLAVSDFLMAITQSPIFFVNSLYKGWIFGETGILHSHAADYWSLLQAANRRLNFSGFFWPGCKMYAFCGALFGIASMINLLTISVDRYIVITKPLRAIQWTSRRRTCIYISLVWLYSLAWSLAPLLGWSQYLSSFIYLKSPSTFKHSVSL